MEQDNTHELPPANFGLRRSSVGVGSVTSMASSVVGNSHMSEEEQDERRRQIKAIMKHSSLSQQEKSRSRQSLMDGRPNRQGSAASTQSTAYSYLSSHFGTQQPLAVGDEQNPSAQHDRQTTPNSELSDVGNV